MMARAAGRAAVRDAPALRFLGLCVGGWVLLRVMMLWNPAIPPPPPAAMPPWERPPELATISFAVGETLRSAGGVRLRADGVAVPPRERPLSIAAAAGSPPAAAGREGSDDRHQLRLALLARLWPGNGAATAAAMHDPVWARRSPATRGEAGAGAPFWLRRDAAPWSGSAWVYVRAGSAATSDGIAAGGQLGGAQAGVRLAYSLGDSAPPLQIYGRATVALQRPQQREVAFGAAVLPLRGLPLDLSVEQRVAAGRDGRTALAALATGGVSDVALPGAFRLEAYGQAGVVGVHRRDGFADGAVAVERRLGERQRISLSLGALAAGAVQPGAARVDVGPRLTLRLPDVGLGSRIALDWRQRVAGQARPESGLALTLAGDF